MGEYGALEVIRQAERIVWAASRYLQEQATLKKLAGTHGPARARLGPRSDVFQVVTYDGEHIGHVRRDGPAGREEHWVAVLKYRSRQVGVYGSAAAAATAPAQACGRRSAKPAENGPSVCLT